MDIRNGERERPFVLEIQVTKYGYICNLSLINILIMYKYSTDLYKYIHFLGSGKTSFCKSLADDNATLAEFHNLEKTRYMQNYKLCLSAQRKKFSLIKKRMNKIHQTKMLYII